MKPQKETRALAKGKQISVPILIVAVVVTAVGTCLVTLLGSYLFIRCRKAKHRAHEQEEANAALDRATVSYMVKDQPSTPGYKAQVRPARSEPAMTTAVAAKTATAGDRGPVKFHKEPAPPAADRRQSLRGAELSPTDSPTSNNKRASSVLTESTERVYAAILARPLEQVRKKPLTPPPEPVPAPRDDVGWPLPSV
jgi:hypothetical protein